MLCCGKDDGRSVQAVVQFALQRTGAAGSVAKDWRHQSPE